MLCCAFAWYNTGLISAGQINQQITEQEANKIIQ